MGDDPKRGLYEKYTIKDRLEEAGPCFVLDLTPGHEPFAPAGLKANGWDVERNDGKSAPGMKHHGCTYYVVELPQTGTADDRDRVTLAVEKLIAAARAYRTGRNQRGRAELTGAAQSLQEADRLAKTPKGGDRRWRQILSHYAKACAAEYPQLARDLDLYLAGKREFLEESEE